MHLKPLTICLNMAWLAAQFAFPAMAAGEAVFHVAATGADAGSLARRSQPFASLERARDAVRAAGTGAARRVIVHGGRMAAADNVHARPPRIPARPTGR